MTNRPCRGITRREALRVGFLGSLALSDYLRLAEGSTLAPSADAAIFIHLQGGPSHLDTLDMKPEAPAEERGEFAPIATTIPGLFVCEHLPRFAQMADQFTLIRGISHSAGAHPLANQYLFSGNPASPAIVHPALGSVLSKERPSRPELPGFVAIPTTEMIPGYLGAAYNPFKTGAMPKFGKPFEVRGLSMAEGQDISKFTRRDQLLKKLDTRLRRADSHSSLLDGLDRLGRKAHEMILSPRARDAFDTGKEPPSIARLFGDDDFNQSLLLAGRLIEHGVRFVTVNFEASWDTHLDNFAALKSKLLPPFDKGITALVQSLGAKGLLERTLVVATGEFGRTPTINKNAGRDHWPRAMWTLMTGGGVRAGQLIGGTDAKGHGPDSGTNLKPDDLVASIYHALGVDARQEYETPSGRPVPLVPGGTVINALFG